MRKRASTSDILSNNRKPTQPVLAQWRPFYDRLMSLREEMLHRRSDTVQAAKEEQPTYGLHMADAGTDQYDLDFSLSMISAEQDALYEIEEALARIRDGNYGVCEITGDPIESERLEAIPWTRFSAKGQREIENNGGGMRIQLGRRRFLLEMESDSRDSDENDDRED